MTATKILIAKTDDVPGILSVRRKTWITTYPNDEYGISYEDIGKHMDKRDEGAVEKWQKYILRDIP